MPAVYVAGTITMDLVSRSERFPKAGETLHGKSFAMHPGGKAANQATAAAKLGANAAVIGKIGQDEFGERMKRTLREQGVRLDFVQETVAAGTGVALIFVADSGENEIVVVPGANGLLSVEDVAQIPVAQGDIVLGQIEVPPVSIEALFRRSKQAGAQTMLNVSPAQPLTPEFFGLADYLIVNEVEFAYYVSGKIDINSSGAILAAARKFRTRVDQAVIVTLGSRGVVALYKDEEAVIPGHKVKAVDTTGAGDTFLGAFAARLAVGDSFKSALAYANAAAAISVQRPGAGSSIPSAAEVEMLLVGR